MSERLVGVGRRIRRLGEGRLRGVARVVHDGLTATQVQVARRSDRIGHPALTPEESADLAARVTMIVKTFERPRVLRRLIRSARRGFPGRIVVADDSRSPVHDLGEGIEVVALPFNVGLSAGRNAALDRVESEYVFVTDDDIVFTPATDFAAMVQYLDVNPEVDIIGVQLVNLPWWYAVDNTRQALYLGAAPPLRPTGELIGGVPVVHKVENVFLARTDSIRRIRWDDRLRLVEHRDFFSRASGQLLTVQATGVRAYHVQARYDDFYMQYRLDLASSFDTANRIWSERQSGAPEADRDAGEG